MTNKTRNILIWVIAGFVAFVFAFVGIAKLLGVEAQIEKLNGWGFPLWTRFPIGIIELALGIGIIIPHYRKLTIYLILVWGVAAVITYIQAGQALQSLLPLALALIAAVILPLSRNKTTA